MKRFSLGLMGLVILTQLLTGCATQRTHKEVTTVNSPAGTETVTTTTPSRETTVVEETTTTTAQEPSGGIISGTLGLIGKIIAFPFKVVGGIIEAIF